MVDIALGLALLVVAIVVAALYKEVAVLAGQASAGSKWPLRHLMPGQPLPAVSELSPDYSGFVLLADTQDAFAAAVSLEAAAEEWEVPCVLIVSGGAAETGWLRRLPDRDRTIVAAPETLMRSLGPRAMPTALYLRDGAVLDASSDVLSPSRVLERFRLAAAPLHQLANSRL